MVKILIDCLFVTWYIYVAKLVGFIAHFSVLIVKNELSISACKPTWMRSPQTAHTNGNLKDKHHLLRKTESSGTPANWSRQSMHTECRLYVCAESADTHLMMKGMKGASPRGEEDPSMGEGYSRLSTSSSKNRLGWSFTCPLSLNTHTHSFFI